MTAQASTPTPIAKVAIVGGPASIVASLEKHFAEFNIQVSGHLADVVNAKGKARHVDTYPVGTDAVLCLYDTTSHAVSESAKTSAKKAGLPFVGIPRKWCKAEPILRAQGILPPASRKEGATPSDAEIEDLVLSFLCDERSKGRVPTVEEAETIVHRAFGPTVDLSMSVWDDAYSKAAQRVPILKEDAKKATPPPFQEQLREWAWALLEEAPERLLDTTALHVQVLKDFPKADRIILDKYFAETLDRFRARMESDIEWRNDLRYKWLVRQFLPSRDGKTPCPTLKVLDEISFKVFRRKADYALAPKARAEALGEWAKDVCRIKEGAQYAFQRWGLSEDTFLTFIREGTIKSFQTGTMVFTSKLAIDEWYENQLTEKDPFEDYNYKEKAPEKVIPVTEPTEPILAGLDLQTEVPPPVDTKAIVQEAVLEMLALFEQSHTKTVAPIEAEMKALREVVAQQQQLIEMLIQKVKVFDLDSIRESYTAFHNLQRDEHHSMMNVIVGVAKAVSAFRDDVQKSLDQKAASTTDITLRDLGKLARDAGLRVTVTTPGETVG